MNIRFLEDAAEQRFQQARALLSTDQNAQLKDAYCMTPLFFEEAPEVTPEGDLKIDLSSSLLPNPVGKIKRTVDLLPMISRTLDLATDPRKFLGENFYQISIMLAANIGSILPDQSLPLVCDFPSFKEDMKHNPNVEFKSGARLDPEYSLQIVSSLRSIGLGFFIGIEYNNNHHRLLFANLISEN